MYTEDDEEVKVKNKKSKNDYNDFYTSFSEQEEKETKKGKKKANDEEDIQTEEDYQEFYDNDEVVEEKDNSRIKLFIRIGIIALLAIILLVLVIILLNKNNDDPGDIVLEANSFELKSGEKKYISYSIVDTEEEVTSKFYSSDEKVVTVDDNGEITAIGNGEATITIKYRIGHTNKEKTCKVKVTGPEVKHEISLDLKASTTSWTNKNVTITVSTKTDTAITYLKYAINCSDNCTYNDVKDNKIVISNNGTIKVVVVAKDKSNLESKKEITVKIDKDAPTVKLNSSTNITSDKDVSVCATCSDSISGCKHAKVCKKFTSSKSNQTITVYDNAGNSKTTQSFNVKINKIVQPCTLKVSSDGIVSATLKETAVYYGFNSTCTGNNELSQKITISASKKGETKAKLVNYYIKNKNGNIGSCHITVIKECKCTDPKSTDNNCPVTCTFRSN